MTYDDIESNKNHRIQSTCLIETNLSDFHRMDVAVISIISKNKAEVFKLDHKK